MSMHLFFAMSMHLFSDDLFAKQNCSCNGVSIHYFFPCLRLVSADLGVSTFALRGLVAQVVRVKIGRTATVNESGDAVIVAHHRHRLVLFFFGCTRRLHASVTERPVMDYVSTLVILLMIAVSSVDSHQCVASDSLASSICCKHSFA